MITSPPSDFWDKVIERVAKLIWQAECNNQRSAAFVVANPLPNFALPKQEAKQEDVA